MVEIPAATVLKQPSGITVIALNNLQYEDTTLKTNM